MNIAAELLPRSWLVAGAIFSAIVLAWCAAAAPWRRLRDARQLHVFLGTTVALMVLWRIAASVPPGISLHFLGATVATLMFGARLSAVCLALVVASQVLIGKIEPAAAPFLLALCGFVPIALSRLLTAVVERRLPAHFFVYVFVGAFLNGGVAMAATAFAAVAALALSGAEPMQSLVSVQLPYLLMLSWGEAFMTGGVITLLIVYRPGWVVSYDSDRLLGRG